MADPGPYQILMEGFESTLARAFGEGDGEERNYAVDAKGRKYLSARAQHHGRED